MTEFGELVGCVGQYVSGIYVAVFGGVCVVRRDSIRRSVSVASDNVKGTVQRKLTGVVSYISQEVFHSH